ncbi:MAG: chemoreceptor glutamine deamidase CheD [Salinisphaeraceae bacterium]|nr:chemoreceptor glutamine deamidase CheD [Salinisphaeraceae bacterium]
MSVTELAGRQHEVVSDSAGVHYYHDRHFHRDAITLLPGHFVVTQRPILLVTVLGSCISACMRDPVTGICGMNHFMLPQGELSPFSAPARYGSHAMELLINAMLKMGASRDRLEAKIFGGGRIHHSKSKETVGERNAYFAQQYLATENIPVVAKDVMGKHARKIFFMTESGKVRVREILQDTARLQEQKYSDTLAPKAAPDDSNVELFT